jgi:glycosyltransferase involved in cell wall biosynthesis
MGANHARNVGTADARGPLVAYLDSDDAFLPEKLAHAARCAAADPAIDLFAGGGYVRRADGSLKLRPSRPIAPNEDISDFYFAAGQRFLTSSLVVRTTAARAVRWDEGLSKVQDPDFVIRLVRAGYRLDYEPTPGVVLFDDIQAGRISNSIALANMIDWLARSGHYLTPRARAGFEVYALASEAARLSRRSGLAHLARAATRAPWRLTAKSLYRIVVPAAAFKATARLSPGTRRSRELAEFLRNLDPAALEPPVAS